MAHTYRSRAHTIITSWLERRYFILFYGLLLTMIATPVISLLGIDSRLFDIFLAANLATALAGIKNRHFSRLLLGLFFITAVIRLAAGFADMQPAVSATHFAWVIFAFIAATDAVRSAMISNKINAEHLYAALSAYILFGLFFGVLHWAVGEQWPNAYNVPDGTDFSLHAAIYFSYVTQTTLGYGDIFPKIQLARSLATFQAIAGQLYLAVMVARIVSLYVTHSEKDSE